MNLFFGFQVVVCCGTEIANNIEINFMGRYPILILLIPCGQDELRKAASATFEASFPLYLGILHKGELLVG